jgi:hypothetical protein
VASPLQLVKKCLISSSSTGDVTEKVAIAPESYQPSP